MDLDIKKVLRSHLVQPQHFTGEETEPWVKLISQVHVRGSI